MQTLLTKNWADYELLATGDGKRIERVGKHLIVRADPTVLWPLKPSLVPEMDQADALFEQGEWVRSAINDPWIIQWEEMKLKARLTPFRHIGVFPEQAANWKWLQEIISQAQAAGKKLKVLNLFGYTGAASIVAALAGAEVCHVDASKGTVFWASDNARLSKAPEKAIRWIVDDARKFVAREEKRGQKYDLVLMDPPSFGRGTKGEVWRLEDDLPDLLKAVGRILADQPAGFLLNFYATDLYPEAIARLTQNCLPKINLTLSELCLEESKTGNSLQTGYVLRS